MMSDGGVTSGRVYLVGAGPGAAGLITLRGVECLRRADVVMYDYLVNPRLLAHVRAGAERIGLGGQGGSRAWPQEEVTSRMIELARSGATVVRLKAGDPAVFARCAEEAEALHEHGIPFEIVPGITAGLAAASCAGVPITHRELASAVALITGHEVRGKGAPRLDYASLAGFPGTLVFYMGVTTAGIWSSGLVRAGKPPDTPAVIIRRCSLPDQRTVHCTLGEVAERLAPATEMRPPVIVIVGRAAGMAHALSWFERRPLFGRTVMVTRPADESWSLAEMLEEQGANVVLQPAIAVRPPEDWGPVDDAIGRMSEFDWVVFSSVNGVRALLDRVEAVGRDLRVLGPVRLAAIGPATAAELAKYRLRADRQPSTYQAEHLAEALAGDAARKRFLLVRANRGRDVLARQLEAAGGRVTQVVAYRSIDVPTPDEQVADQLRGGLVDWVTVTSSAIARSLAAMFGDDLRRARLVSISPLTSGTLHELGFTPSAEATEATMEGVVASIVAAERKAGATQ